MEGNRIGIVGGGQLGRMLTEAAIPLGFHVTVVESGDNCPAKQVGAEQIPASLDDRDAVTDLADSVDVVTWEIEHIRADVLEHLAEEGYDVQPSPHSLSIIKDKLHQKVHYVERGLPVAPFVALDNEDEYQGAPHLLGGNIIVKTREGGYDGRGNLVPSPDQTWAEVQTHFTDKYGDDIQLYAEKIVDFQKELAVIVGRTASGEAAVYPVVETIHKNNICHMVLAPADVEPKVRETAEEIGREAVKSFDGAGVFAVEMFLDEDNNVLINEMAPRVHNSGHLTIEASQTSQFEQHIRAITGLPLGNTEMVSPAAVMINILGERNGDVALEGLDKVLALPDTHMHLYGKSPTKIDRKMGHITVRADNLYAAELQAMAAREQISI